MIVKFGLFVLAIAMLMGFYHRGPPDGMGPRGLLDPFTDVFYRLMRLRSPYKGNSKTEDNMAWPLCQVNPLDAYSLEKHTQLGLLGHVFDVSTSPHNYGRNGAYGVLTGKDASRAFISGEFSKKDLTDNLDGISTAQLGELVTWLRHFGKKYKCIGYIPGRFFEPSGAYTSYLLSIREAGEAIERQRTDHLTAFPQCSVDTDGVTNTVSCHQTANNGRRLLRPRRYFEPGRSYPRCACVHPTLLSDARLKLYPGCDEQSHECSYNIKELQIEDKLGNELEEE